MTTLLALLIGIGLVGALAYRGAALTAWTVTLAIYLAAIYLAGVLPLAGVIVVLLIMVPIAVVLHHSGLRQRLVTRRLFAYFRAVLPPMSDTEREAMEAGDCWWETELFRGAPAWRQLHETPVRGLAAHEQAFLDNEVDTLCAMLDEDQIVRRDHDLPPQAWRYIQEQGFFGLIIPEAFGGRAFSSQAQSAVVAKIATRSLSAAVTVMVPNSLGPGELLMKYGTEAQRSYWLPRLADGREIPCFALTGPDVGSDAGSMPDHGVVTRGEHDGSEVLGIRLNFTKRYITLAPVATVLGVAFKLYDPDGLLGGERDLGITCALLPANHDGVRLGERHFPMGLAFMNGPIEGEDVFIPVEWIIGGEEMAGRGWRMLVECLSVGRAISLPALGTAASQLAYRMTGAYARIRRQFKLPVGRFEGVQEAMGRIGGGTYTLEAARRLTASAGDLGVKPAVVSGIAKYHLTEGMREVVNDAMDVHGGKAIMFGPRNYLGYAYQATPVAITVEGANILTRNLMIFGQGAMRCHPYIFAEMEAVGADDLPAFDRLLGEHVRFGLSRGVRAFTMGLTGARSVSAPVAGPTAHYYRQLTRMSAALAVVSDVTMAVLGGQLKRKERLSARLGDVLSQLYLASAVLKLHYDGGQRDDELPYVQWSVERSLAAIQQAFDGFFDNFPNRPLARLLRFAVFPLGRAYRGPGDALGGAIAESMMTSGGVRDRVSHLVYAGDSADDVTGRIEHAFYLLERAEPAYEKYQKAVGRGQVTGLTFVEQLKDARSREVLSEAEASLVAEYERYRYEAVVTDAFPAEELAPAGRRETAGEQVA